MSTKRTLKQKKLVNLEIIKKINELGLSVQYSAIKQLYKILKEYQDNDYSININIDCTEINRKIIGILPIGTKNKPSIRMIILDTSKAE